jgi:four helix bundle protein
MQELKIQQKCEDMIKYVYTALRYFPKSERFTLAADIKESMFKILSLIIRCNKARDKNKYFKEIDIELIVFKSYIRLSMELEFIPIKKYENISNYITEIGKMLGGWIKKYTLGASL